MRKNKKYLAWPAAFFAGNLIAPIIGAESWAISLPAALVCIILWIALTEDQKTKDDKEKETGLKKVQS
jgi:hypothetical protein